jgi:hypothetical protein
VLAEGLVWDLDYGEMSPLSDLLAAYGLGFALPRAGTLDQE